jgi:hypothetical protein
MRDLWRRKSIRTSVYVAVLGCAMGLVVAAAPWRRPNDNGPLPVYAGKRLASHVDPRLSRVAGSLAGRRLQVRCWSPSDWRARASEVRRDSPGHYDVRSPWSGYLSLDRKRANFGPSACGRLAALVYDKAGPSGYNDSWWLSWSLALFAHVIGPSGTRATSECRAMQRIRPTGEALGLSADTAARLARLFWNDVYPREDAKFRSDECRPGGKLDLDPTNPAWP